MVIVFLSSIPIRHTYGLSRHLCYYISVIYLHDNYASAAPGQIIMHSKVKVKTQYLKVKALLLLLLLVN